MYQQKRSKKPTSTENLLQSKQRPIRSWRDGKMPMLRPVFAPDNKKIERSLRQERARSGRIGYDINRHIRLAKWHRAITAQ
jgi:hypothetical protein